MGLTQKLGTIPLAIQTDSSNNVGIGGAANASYKLAVTGASLFSSSINSGQIQATAGGAGIQLIGQAGSNAYYVNDQAANSGKRWRFGHTGAVSGYNSFDFYNQTDDRLVMTLASNGNVGIGTSSPTDMLHIEKSGATVYNSLRFTNPNSTANFYVGIGGSSTANGSLQNNAYLYNAGNSAMIFATNDTERMRITGTGSVQINGPTLSAGDPSTYALRVGQSGGVNLSLSWNSSAGYIQTFASTPLYLNQQGNSVFANGSAGFGLVTTTSSDIRIKKNITSIELALDKVNALRGVYYEFDENNELGISVPNGKTRVGLIAQEVETIIPEAVLDSDNENTPKSVDYTGLVGLLVKAIQELNAKVTALENK